MKFLRKAYFALLTLLPAVLFFSYYPLISLGSDATMNFELSLPLIFLILFDATAFLSLMACGWLKSSFKKLSATNGERSKQGVPVTTGDDAAGFVKKASASRTFISDRKFFLFALFPLYSTLSIFWSANPTRAILTAGVLWLTFFAAFAIIYITPLLDPAKSLWKTLIFSLFISTAVVCLFCWIQCLLDVLNVPRETTLLCPGCTYRTFGFPHPSGFAIEPQFMGNLLLAPTLLALYFLVSRNKNSALTDDKSSKRPSATNGERNECRLTRNDGMSQTCRVKNYHSLVLLCAILFSSTLFLTLSRGAIYAYAVAVFILFIFALIRRQKWLYLIIIPVITFFLTLTAQGIFSAASPTSDTFISGTTKIIHQLSLGLIDLRPQSAEPTETSPETPTTSVDTQPTVPTPVEPVENLVENSQFDGYIPASTNTRLGLNAVALETWLSSPYYIFFGVGLGGAGVAMSETFPENPYAVPDAIVQNEPISLLLELGLFGAALILLAFALAFIPGRFLKFLRLSPAETAPDAPSFWHLPILPVFLAIIVAYLITLNFFSGLPNALHIYLLPPLIYLAYQNSSTHQLPSKSQKSAKRPKNYCHGSKPVLK